MTDTPETNTAAAFENLLMQLQELVGHLESNQMTLDEAIGTYERSVEIANRCTQMLDEAELRIATIDVDSRTLREDAIGYQFDARRAATLLLGDDDDDLSDLLDDE